MNLFTSLPGQENEMFQATKFKVLHKGQLMALDVFNMNDGDKGYVEQMAEEILGANAWLQSQLTGGFYPVKIKMTGRKTFQDGDIFKHKAKLTFFEMDFDSKEYTHELKTVDAWVILHKQ